MARLPIRGSSVASPPQDQACLHDVLSNVHVGHAFDATAVDDLHSKLGSIIGKWMSEQARLEVSVVGKALLSVAKNLNEVSALLGGLETGIHSNLETEVALRTRKYL